MTYHYTVVFREYQLQTDLLFIVKTNVFFTEVFSYDILHAFLLFHYGLILALRVEFIIVFYIPTWLTVHSAVLNQLSAAATVVRCTRP